MPICRVSMSTLSDCCCQHAAETFYPFAGLTMPNPPKLRSTGRISSSRQLLVVVTHRCIEADDVMPNGRLSILQGGCVYMSAFCASSAP